jgi:nicotinate phosphoribosyltransferase
VFGTAAISWFMSFDSEVDAFRELQKLLGYNTVQLIDTYDTLEGARAAASLGAPLRAVRIDSGDLDTLSRQVRGILDAAGLPEARIMASGDLDENRIAELVASGAPIVAFGVGTVLVTSGDAPSMGMIYKLVELTEAGHTRLTAKRSPDKPSVPGVKQVWRFPGQDLVALEGETVEGARPLLHPLMRDGRRVAPATDLTVARALACRPEVRPVRFSPLLEEQIARLS